MPLKSPCSVIIPLGMVFGVIFCLATCEEEVLPDPPTPVIFHRPEALTDSSVQLTWDRSNSSEFAHYLLTWDTDSSFQSDNFMSLAIRDVDSVSIQFADPLPDRMYYFRVFIVETDGDSAGSNTVAYIFTRPVILQVPFVLEPDSVQLTWSASPSPVFSVYQVWYGLDSTFHPDGRHERNVTDRLDTTVILPGLDAIGTWFFRVWIYTTTGDSIGSKIHNTFLPGIDPLQPVVLNTPERLDSGAVRVSWSRSETEIFKQYVLWYGLNFSTSDRREVVIDDREQLSYTIEEIDIEGLWYFQLWVHNTDGDSLGSNVISYLLETRVVQPVVLQEPYEVSYEHAGIEWSISEEPDFTAYHVWHDTSADFSSPNLNIQVIPDRNYTGTELQPLEMGTTYHSQVWVHVATGDSASSNIITFETPVIASAQPTRVLEVIRENQNSVRVTWARTPTDPDGFWHYDLYLAQGDSTESSFVYQQSIPYQNDTTETLSGLLEDTPYFVRVDVVGISGPAPSPAFPFMLPSHFAIQEHTSDENGQIVAEMDDLFVQIQFSDTSGETISGVHAILTRTVELLSIVTNSNYYQPQYRIIELDPVEGSGISGTGTELDPLVIEMPLDPVTIGYQVFEPGNPDQLEVLLDHPQLQYQLLIGDIFSVRDHLVTHLDRTGPIIQLSQLATSELSTTSKYLSLSAEVLLAAPEWYEVIVGDGLGLYSDDELTCSWAESPDGYPVTPVYVMSVDTSRSFVYKFTLTWGEHPRDLDSYLWTPEIEGSAYEVFYGARGSETELPFAELDVDDMQSWGPESITITQLFPGTYRYSVNHYAGWSDDSLTISTSQAQVRIADAGGNVQTVTVPEGESEPWWYWHVLEIDGETGEITIINELSADEPDDIRGSLHKQQNRPTKSH